MKNDEYYRRLDREHRPATRCLCYHVPEANGKLTHVKPDYCPIHGTEKEKPNGKV